MIEYIKELILLFGTPTAVIALVAYSIWHYKSIEDRLKIGDSKFNSIEKNMMIIGRTALRLEIVNDKIPMLERGRAYEQYVRDFEGNGSICKYYEKEVEPYLAEEYHQHHSV